MALSFNQLEAITTNKFMPQLVDNVYKKHALLARMSAPERKVVLDGGIKIQQAIVSSQSNQGGYFENFDTLSKTPTDNISAATYEWKQAFEPIAISRAEILKNSGDAQKLQLVASKVMVAEMGIRRTLTLGVFSDGTAGTGAETSKQIDGLQAVLSTSSTYGGIAVADLADWVAIVKANGGTDRALSLALMQSAYQDASDGTEKPTVVTCKNNVYNNLWSLYQPHQRLVSEEMSALGFKNILTFNGAPVLTDENMKDNSLFFINEDFLKLAVMRGEDLRMDKISSLEDSNSSLWRIFWMGNIVTSRRDRHAELADIEATA